MTRAACAAVLAAALVLALTGVAPSRHAVAATTSAASSGSCAKAKPSGLSLAVANSGVDAPAGGIYKLAATVGITRTTLRARDTVTYTVTCGPDEGQTGTAKARKDDSSISTRPLAALPIKNRGGFGTDLVSITAKSSSTTLGPVTASVTWRPSVDCGDSFAKLGYLEALECKVDAAKANPIVKGVLQGVDCAVGVASFFVPPSKLAKLATALKDASTLAKLKASTKALHLGGPVTDLARDLWDARKAGGTKSWTQFLKLIRDIKDAADFLRDAKTFLGDLPRSDAQKIGSDMLRLAGLGSCLDLLDKIPFFGGPNIITRALPPATVGKPYSAQLSTADHRPGIWTVTKGALPAGLKISGYTLTGTPSTPGNTRFVLRFTDATGKSATGTASVTVRASVTAIAAGSAHACALVSGGHVYCWGDNEHGGLGDGTTAESTRAVAVTGISTATAISSGGDHTCTLINGGNVDCWGDNQYGQLGDGTTTDSALPVTVSGIETATAVSGGNEHTCALLSDGHVDCWGDNEYGSLGDGTTDDSSAPVEVSGISSARAIAAANDDTCALLSGGQVDCWGFNEYGELGNGTEDNSLAPAVVSGIDTAVAVAASDNHTCALVEGGSVKCWGDNENGDLGDGTTTYRITPVPVSGISTAVAIAAGGSHTCALLDHGSLDCWGDNLDGALGDGTTTDRSTPAPVTGIETASAVAAGEGYSCALLNDGVDCWGDNYWGQLGDGTSSNSSTPVAVLGL